MSLSRTGAVPVLRRVAVPAMAVLAAALLNCGCSSRPNGTTSYIWNNQQPYNVAAAPVPRPVEMEDDGREAQVPPPASIRDEPDDPREPFSPNYGGPSSPIRRSPANTADAAGVGPPPAIRAQALREGWVPAPQAVDTDDAAPTAADRPPVARRKLASAASQD